MPLRLKAARLIDKPYYLFRPAQIVRRVRVMLAGPCHSATLPWGLSIRFDPDETVGSAISRTGIYDTAVCEALHRLADPGELAVDAGANIGVMAGLLGTRVGPSGEVIAVEPNPSTYAALEENVAGWVGVTTFTLVRKALSDRGGSATLHLPGEAAQSTLDNRGPPIATVERAQLDELIGERSVGIMKLDVEGHEEAVLKGARRALSERRIRDIVFEEFAEPPTAVTELLEEAGYVVFKLDPSPFALRLAALSRHKAHRAWEPPSYVATVDPERALSRIGSPGWRVLRAPRRS